MMDTVAFNERIMRTVWDKCKPASVLMVIALVLLGIDIVYLFVTKSNAGFAVLNIRKCLITPRLASHPAI